MDSFPRHVQETYSHTFLLDEAGLVAIKISAQCQSAQQLKSNTDEDLRIMINGLQCRETFPEKYTQLFNIPPAFNGSKLKGLQKTVIFLTVLGKGLHVVSLIPRPTATVDNINIQKLSVNNNKITLDIQQQAEDGERRPWYTFVPVDLPLSEVVIDATVKRRLWDSDDLKIIINDEIQGSVERGQHKYWFLLGGLLGWIIDRKGRNRRVKTSFPANLDQGLHYIEIHADRMPVLHKVTLAFTYTKTEPEKRVSHVIEQNTHLIKLAAREFDVDPAIVAAVIY